MAKRNNKGFSLIEIVIAMAVLTILLTPIIKQFAQTMKVSRQAKEMQYVNEEASYTLEEAQVTPTKQLMEIYNKEVADNPTYTLSTSTDTYYCELRTPGDVLYSITNPEGEPYKNEAGVAVAGVPYTVETYKIGNVELGPENALYNKVVTVDNLATQVRDAQNSLDSSKGFQIKYNMKESELPSGYTLTSEGAGVKLQEGTGNIVGVIVEEVDYVGNPNNTNLGNMQNLDYETVAMINGTATNFDEQAEKALFSKAMDDLKKIDYEEWQKGMLQVDAYGILQQAGYYPTMSKVTKIHVAQLHDNALNKNYYLVKADVYYRGYYTLKGKESKAELSYNVFSQKFYTDKCPDIYFEYQPFISELVENPGSYSVTYAENDYILLDCCVEDADPKTDGIQEPKLYLYKPFNDASSVSVGTGTYEHVENYTYTTKAPSASIKNNKTAYEQFLLDNSVAIHLAHANAEVFDMKVYTNLNTEDNGDKSQFFYSAGDFNTTIYDATYDKNIIIDFKFVESDFEIYHNYPKADFPKENLNPLDKDTRYDDRLRTVTVSLIPIKNANSDEVRDNANTVRLSGAKGEK